jgi:hypothetical protein
MRHSMDIFKMTVDAMRHYHLSYERYVDIRCIQDIIVKKYLDIQ